MNATHETISETQAVEISDAEAAKLISEASERSQTSEPVETQHETISETQAQPASESESSEMQTQTSEPVAKATKAKATKAKAPQKVAPVETQAPVEKFKSGIDELHALMHRVPDRQVSAMQASIAEQFNERSRYEREQKSNAVIQAKLAKLQKVASREMFARFLCVLNISPSFVNEGKRSTSRYNVYAIDKLVNLYACLARHDSDLNVVNRACLSALFAFDKAKLTFRHRHAQDASSIERDVSRYDERTRACFTFRHKLSAGVASTQASSTMRALQTLGVCERDVDADDDDRNVCYRLNRDALITRALRDFIKRTYQH